MIGDVELRPLGARLSWGGGVANHDSSGAGKQWDVAFLGGGILGVHESDTQLAWHVEMEARFQARIGSNVEGLFFFSVHFFQQLPAAAETSQAIAGFPNSVAHQLIITLPRLFLLEAQGTQLLDILKLDKPYTRQPRVEAV